MIYPYRCPSCGWSDERYKPASESGTQEYCGCGTEMVRVWTPTAGRIGMIQNRPPRGCVELGNERVPAKSQVRDYDDRGLREELNSGRYPELERLPA